VCSTLHGARSWDQEGGKLKGDELERLTLEYMKQEHPGVYEAEIVFNSSVHLMCLPIHVPNAAIMLDIWGY
jgi:hypothetical protein